MRRRRPALLAGAAAVAVLALAVLPAGVLAATCPRTSVADIEDEVMCPVCKTPLALAQEAPQADRERAFILERVERCQSKRTIKLALAAEFGDDVLAVPDDEGFDLAAYLVPAIVFVTALGACALAVRRWRRGGPVLAGSSKGDDGAGRPRGVERPQPEPAAAARLERDIERYDL